MNRGYFPNELSRKKSANHEQLSSRKKKNLQRKLRRVQSRRKRVDSCPRPVEDNLAHIADEATKRDECVRESRNNITNRMKTESEKFSPELSKQ